MRTRIVGTGRALPGKVLTNDDLSRMVDTSDAWITERTGIKQRYILEEGRTTSDLVAEAARAAAEKAGWDAKDIECLILGTVTGDMPMPATAVYAQAKLGCNGGAAFDLSAACAGFLYGLAIGDAFVKAGQYRRVVVVGCEVLSRILDWSDRNTCVLFGDGAGAVALAPGTDGDDTRGILSTHLFADGTGADFLTIPVGGTRTPATPELIAQRAHTVKMNGRAVFAHAVKNLAAAAQAAMQANALGPDDVDLVVAHQANLRIISGVAERCQLPLSKFHLNIARYGNTSSASVPIALDEAIEQGKVQRGARILMCALGAGFSWGSAVVRW